MTMSPSEWAEKMPSTQCCSSLTAGCALAAAAATTGEIFRRHVEDPAIGLVVVACFADP